jgi:hypothetical protein
MRSSASALAALEVTRALRDEAREQALKNLADQRFALDQDAIVA